jgi:hypothetical protein
MQFWNKIKHFEKTINDINEYNYSSVPILVGEFNNRLIITKRNSQGKSLPFIYEIDLNRFELILKNEKPILNLGDKGYFDEDGVMPVCSLNLNKKIYLYYIGWNLSVSVPFRNSIGLAISEDGGETFYKPYKGPLLDRSIHDPCFVASCCVIEDNGIFKMWYLSCDSWELVDGKMHHKYNIKYSYSYDSINWIREGKIAIDYLWKNEYAISVPRVIKEKSIYKMWYSYRGKNEIDTYRIGYAESLDGIIWTRKDDEVKMEISENGWDSEMICYPFIFDYKSKRYMLYNGNGYGKTGFGLAILEK